MAPASRERRSWEPSSSVPVPARRPFAVMPNVTPPPPKYPDTKGTYQSVRQSITADLNGLTDGQYGSGWSISNRTEQMRMNRELSRECKTFAVL